MKRFIQTCAAVCLLAVSAFAQGTAVNQTQGPPPTAWVPQYFYNASSQVTYICYAPLFARTTTFAIGATPGLTSIAVATNVGTVNFAATAYVWVGQQITVAGSTTAALNGTYKVTAVSGSTATITTSGVGDATYNNAALTVSSSQPLLNSAVWSIQAFAYASVGGNLTNSYWAGTPVANGVPGGLACSSRANY